MLAAKFGLAEYGETERALTREGLQLLYDAEIDYTRFFRSLGELTDAPREGATPQDVLDDVFYDEAKRDAHAGPLMDWLRRWHALVSADALGADARRVRMHAVNPRFVLRNYLAQEAIDAAEAGDPSLVHTLLEVMRRPYDEQPEHARFAARRPEWARDRAGCSMLSCSS